jgi:cytochrome c553
VCSFVGDQLIQFLLNDWIIITSAQSSSTERRLFQQYPLTHNCTVYEPQRRCEIDPCMLQGASAEAIGRGATLALRCTMCHGARGLSQADTPNLAGQYPVTIYKELVDFKTGARPSAVMAPLVVDLSDEDMRDLAAYYAYLPRVTNSGPAAGEPPRIVASGAPLRSIATCGACHGEVDSRASAAWLEGQPAIYLHTQLDAFASGARHSDIG